MKKSRSKTSSAVEKERNKYNQRNETPIVRALQAHTCALDLEPRLAEWHAMAWFTAGPSDRQPLTAHHFTCTPCRCRTPPASVALRSPMRCAARPVCFTYSPASHTDPCARLCTVPMPASPMRCAAWPVCFTYIPACPPEPICSTLRSASACLSDALHIQAVCFTYVQPSLPY